MKHAAAAILLVGGFLVVLGSFSAWGACSQDPCHPALLGLMHFYERSGIDVGWGIVTAVLGCVLLLLGVSALRGRARRPLVERGAALGIVLAVGLHLLLTTFGPSAADDGLTGTLYIGGYVTVLGAVVVLVGSTHPRADRKSRSPGRDPGAA
jgi:hypothetical protein